jgi:hypothetical protein
MQVSKLLASSRPHLQVNAVVVCVERGALDGTGVRDEQIDDLARRLRTLIAERQLGTYDGRDNFSGESRLYLFSAEPDMLASAAMEVIDTLDWRGRVRVRVSLDPLGTQWRSIEK